MKWKAALFALALVFPLCAGADTYVKIERHTDGYYRGGTMNPEVNETQEIWISPTRIAIITDGQKLLLDSEKKMLMVVDLRDNSYTETALPLDMAKLLTEPEFAQSQMFQITGEVKKADEKKKFGERECSGYELSDWIMFQGGKVNEREIKMWVSTDMPFDLEKYDELFFNVLKLNNFSDDYLAKVKAIDGFQIAQEETTYAEGLAIKTTSKVVEVVEKETPADVFSIPEDCRKKETLNS